MKKKYVLDTNVLIHNPNCIGKFEDNDVYIPHIVIEELDGLKSAKGETGYSAREAIRVIGGFRKRGNILEGVQMDEGGRLFIYMMNDTDDLTVPDGWKKEKPDNLILFSVLWLKKSLDEDVILVSNDSNMQVKADLLGIAAQEYRNDRIVDLDTTCYGRSTRHISNEGFQMFCEKGEVPVDYIVEDKGAFIRNEFVNILTWEGNSMLSQYNGENLVKLKYQNDEPYGLKPRNSGQIFLQESLMSSCPLTICIGTAGTGKTLFAIGCGLEQVAEQKKYKRVLLCRPNVTMDEEIGFLPGSEMDKISPLLRGVYDNLEVLLGNIEDTKEQIKDKIDELYQRDFITAQSIAYLRGRSIPNTYIIIDECQNTTPNQILSVITRAGVGSKIVLLGDPNQIDSPRLDSRNNGLVYAAEKMKGSPLCEIVSFKEKECTRSPLAREASERLKK